MQIIPGRKCWLYEHRDECDRFRFRGEKNACGGHVTNGTLFICADKVEKNDRVKLDGGNKNT